MKYNSEIEEIINNSGELGSIQRLITIASLDLGERSLSAQRCLDKRAMRLHYMNIGLSFEDACTIVRNNYP